MTQRLQQNGTANASMQNETGNVSMQNDTVNVCMQNDIAHVSMYTCMQADTEAARARREGVAAEVAKAEQRLLQLSGEISRGGEV